MISFRGSRLATEPVPMTIVNLVGQINEFKGKQQLYHQQSPQLLEGLMKAAVVQSTDASNRIEGIEVPLRDIEALVAETAAPRNRSEEEVAGYRDVLRTIHRSHAHIPVTPSVIQQFHRDLYAYSATPGGRWKSVDNTIDDILPDGTHQVRFRTVPAVGVPHAMDELCVGLRREEETGIAPSLLLAGAFVLDFLCIHPFQDGNGRLSRLLTLQLLYRSGYEVGRYISLERVTERSKESYYDALAQSSRGWHEGRHSLIPWWEYFLGVIAAAYRDFEHRVGLVGVGRGAKSEHVRKMIEERLGEFSISELEQLCPHVSRDTIRTVLQEMKAEGIIRPIGRGRGARWAKVAERE